MSSKPGIPVRITIQEMRGERGCMTGMQLGQTWEVFGEAAPEGLCGWAYSSMLPFIAALRYGGTFPWNGQTCANLSCPDADNPVVFRVEAIR